MKAVAHGPPAQDLPYVPDVVVTDDGARLTERGPAGACDVAPFSEPVDLPDGAWLAVGEDGRAEVFLKIQASEWRSRRAVELVGRATALPGRPLESLSLLRAAAALVGVSLADLLASVGRARVPGESLEDAFLKVRERATRGR